MLINQSVLPRLGVALAILSLLGARPLYAQTPSDSERIEKLEQAVEQLQKRNAQLEDEVKSLRKTTSFAPIPAEGPTKKQVTYDGKTYVVKSVTFEQSAAEMCKMSSPISELERIFQGAIAQVGSKESEWINAGFSKVEDPGGNSLFGITNFEKGALVVYRTSEFKESGCTSTTACTISKLATLNAAGSFAVTAKEP